jgi:hypothetical protein
MDSTENSSTEKKRKSIKPVASLSKRTEWACWMNGADSEWLSTPAAQRLASAFPHGLPQWLVKSQPWRLPTGAMFATVRKNLLQLTVKQCAAYLGVPQAQVRRWESGEDQLPLAAFEALRLQSETAFSQLSHRAWDGWYIDHRSGEFMSPDLGRLSFTPGDLNSVPTTFAELSQLRDIAKRQAFQINELEAENAALRTGSKVKTVAGELAAMHDRIGELLGELQTAAVLPFPSPKHQPALRKAAS